MTHTWTETKLEGQEIRGCSERGSRIDSHDGHFSFGTRSSVPKQGSVGAGDAPTGSTGTVKGPWTNMEAMQISPWEPRISARTRILTIKHRDFIIKYRNWTSLTAVRIGVTWGNHPYLPSSPVKWVIFAWKEAVANRHVSVPEIWWFSLYKVRTTINFSGLCRRVSGSWVTLYRPT